MIKNKNILITGGNSGIGLFAIINLLKTKNNLYVVIKSELRKNEILKKIEKYFDKNYFNKYINIIENIDLSDLENIKKLKKFLNASGKRLTTSNLNLLISISPLHNQTH